MFYEYFKNTNIVILYLNTNIGKILVIIKFLFIFNSDCSVLKYIFQGFSWCVTWVLMLSGFFSSCHYVLAIVNTSVTINGYKTASQQLLPAQGHSTSVTGTL